jgi:hypothetical protein
MHWIIQDNLFHESGLEDLLATLRQIEAPYSMVKVVPFSHEMIPDLQPDGLVITMGATSLSGIAKSRGWSPGTFLNDNHDFRVWSQAYQGHLLNEDAQVVRFGDMNPSQPLFFVRPCDDGKQFAGCVMDRDEFVDWQRKVIDLKETYTSLDANTMVLFATPQIIMQEIRFFVVDGRIITGSLYKRGNRVIYSSDLDDPAKAFAQTLVDHWCPARGFVLDIALTDNGYKVIEINCLNSAGLYASNVAKLVAAIEDMSGF